MDDELAAAVDEVLGGWELALETRGAILPHDLKGWESDGTISVTEIMALMEEIDMEMLEYRLKRALIAAKVMETRARHHREKGEPDGPTYQRGMVTVTSWLDGTNKHLA